jgi:hypothetical protein
MLLQINEGHIVDSSQVLKAWMNGNTCMVTLRGATTALEVWDEQRVLWGQLAKAVLKNQQDAA